jgi:hypothetical protein
LLSKLESEKLNEAERLAFREKKSKDTGEEPSEEELLKDQ